MKESDFLFIASLIIISSIFYICKDIFLKNVTFTFPKNIIAEKNNNDVESRNRDIFSIYFSGIVFFIIIFVILLFIFNKIKKGIANYKKNKEDEVYIEKKTFLEESESDIESLFQQNNSKNENKIIFNNFVGGHNVTTKEALAKFYIFSKLNKISFFKEVKVISESEMEHYFKKQEESKTFFFSYEKILEFIEFFVFAEYDSDFLKNLLEEEFNKENNIDEIIKNYEVDEKNNITLEEKEDRKKLEGANELKFVIKEKEKKDEKLLKGKVKIKKKKFFSPNIQEKKIKEYIEIFAREFFKKILELIINYANLEEKKISFFPPHNDVDFKINVFNKTKKNKRKMSVIKAKLEQYFIEKCLKINNKNLRINRSNSFDKKEKKRKENNNFNVNEKELKDFKRSNSLDESGFNYVLKRSTIFGETINKKLNK